MRTFDCDALDRFCFRFFVCCFDSLGAATGHFLLHFTPQRRVSFLLSCVSVHTFPARWGCSGKRYIDRFLRARRWSIFEREREFPSTGFHISCIGVGALVTSRQAVIAYIFRIQVYCERSFTFRMFEENSNRSGDENQIGPKENESKFMLRPVAENYL